MMTLCAKLFLIALMMSVSSCGKSQTSTVEDRGIGDFSTISGLGEQFDHIIYFVPEQTRREEYLRSVASIILDSPKGHFGDKDLLVVLCDRTSSSYLESYFYAVKLPANSMHNESIRLPTELLSEGTVIEEFIAGVNEQNGVVQFKVD